MNSTILDDIQILIQETELIEEKFSFSNLATATGIGAFVGNLVGFFGNQIDSDINSITGTEFGLGEAWLTALATAGIYTSYELYQYLRKKFEDQKDTNKLRLLDKVAKKSKVI